MGVSQHKWTQYATPVRDQGNSLICWVYTSEALIELMYNYYYSLPYQLSIRQVSENIHEVSSGIYGACNGTHGDVGGHVECALQYMKSMGMMTEYTYQLYGKYNREQILPIGIGDVQRVCDNLGSVDRQLQCLSEWLNKSAVIAIINTVELSYVTEEYDDRVGLTHGVLITDICVSNTQTYIEFKNSWGSGWGECGGYGYIGVKYQNQIRDNRGIFHKLLVADVYDWRGNSTYFDQGILQYAINLSYISIGIFSCAIVIVTAYIGYHFKMYDLARLKAIEMTEANEMRRYAERKLTCPRASLCDIHMLPLLA